MKIQQPKRGKIKLPYYCNPAYFDILIRIEKKYGVRGYNIIKQRNKTSKDSAIYKQLKILEKDHLIFRKKKKCYLTNKGNIILQIAKHYFEAKGNFEDKKELLRNNYNLVMDNFTDNCPNGEFNKELTEFNLLNSQMTLNSVTSLNPDLNSIEGFARKR